MAAKYRMTVLDRIEEIVTFPLMLYRKLRYDSCFRRIFLGDRYFTIVDADDYYWLRTFNWWLQNSGRNLYPVCSRVIPGRKTSIRSMHRMIKKPPKGKLVDHVFGNTLDNRRSQLRFATRSQNQCNRRKNYKKESSKYKGVTYDKENDSWIAQLRIDGVVNWHKRFDTQIAAAKAWDIMAKKHVGRYARLNFPQCNGNPEKLYAKSRKKPGLFHRLKSRYFPRPYAPTIDMMRIKKKRKKPLLATLRKAGRFLMGLF